MNIWKIFQRQCYDILSNKASLSFCVILTYTSVLALFYVCEIVWLNLSLMTNVSVKEFADNIGGKFFQDQLCRYLPVDVVYTWVNGSDPNFLSQLEAQKMKIRKNIAQSCRLPDCQPSHYTAFKTNILEIETILNQLNYVSVESIWLVNINWTLIHWDSVKMAEEQANKMFKVNGRYILPFHVQWSTEEHGSNLYTKGTTIAIKGLGRSVETLSKETLEMCIGKSVSTLWRYPNIIYAELTSDSYVDQILKGKKWNIIFKKHVMKLNITRSSLLLELPSPLKDDDCAASRYDDKEELRYSLRSLEKFAPWVRRVYIVTNGQIPHWLDLSNPRVQVVTHDSLFINSSHLPTFSSSAIETHLHRIPGLSDKFLYINDDIFLGEEVLLEDFLTARGSQKVYLSWPVPDCSAVCPWTWVGDGTCDVPCNTSTCDFDGQDCLSYSTVTSLLHDLMEDETKEDKTFHRSDDQDQSFSLQRQTNKKNKTFVLKYSDLNVLVVLNKTHFKSDEVQDTFALKKLLQVNSSQQIFVKDEKFVGASVNHSVLLNTPAYIPLKDVGRIDKFDRSTRNILGDKKLNMDFTSRIVPTPTISSPSMKRKFSPLDLSRTQVGIPALEVAENFYHIQPKTSSSQRRLDTFAESLLHVNRLFNKKYGYKARRVPAHMPHLIDKNIMRELQNNFPDEYEQTSSRYFRHPEDMQFSFGYFYYIMNEEINVSLSQIFKSFDTDESRTWSDREIRTVLTRLYDLPLQRSSVLNFETSLIYCAKKRAPDLQLPTPAFERYIDSNLPLVTEQLVKSCTLVTDLLKHKMGRKNKFLFTPVKPTTREDLVGFHMITSNLSYMLTTLDKIRRKPKKFICLNDNLDSDREEDNQLIRAVLIDFFHSLFPKPSQFELPSDYRNRYLYYSEFLEWKNKRRIFNVMYTVLITIIVFILLCLFYNELWWLLRKLKIQLLAVPLNRKPTKNKLLAI